MHGWLRCWGSCAPLLSANELSNAPPRLLAPDALPNVTSSNHSMTDKLSELDPPSSTRWGTHFFLLTAQELKVAIAASSYLSPHLICRIRAKGSEAGQRRLGGVKCGQARGRVALLALPRLI
jgi:hypothetical protein